ncbi:gamma-glutamylcyclotransferase family protein [Pseudoroseicyclus tamaricis]|uniref:Gamma-glutamylcyclotransferase n=1 Tax=Pseudoroseicyclus tamaricis TaxID=2705421 RepID=A0A6B2JLQ3_9RHOB|nr:gamma-glutamylcyclotransferase family protein [Pseudoroseicyclus tamaricis]NDV02493.1 gamma-glutamylcyclotransferase [Pseudoroseicyclus tamaricis]
MSPVRRIFGYGSLVNRLTHRYAEAAPARLPGFRRHWQGTRLREVAYLSVTEGDGHILGLAATVPEAEWEALDAREGAYLRHEHAEGLTFYRVARDNASPPGEQQPILLSYLDVVVHGFREEFGEDGARHFFETTDGWDRPILDDRKAPIYPRAHEQSAELMALTDAFLREIGCPVPG